MSILIFIEFVIYKYIANVTKAFKKKIIITEIITLIIIIITIGK